MKQLFTSKIINLNLRKRLARPSCGVCCFKAVRLGLTVYVKGVGRRCGSTVECQGYLGEDQLWVGFVIALCRILAEFVEQLNKRIDSAVVSFCRLLAAAGASLVNRSKKSHSQHKVICVTCYISNTNFIFNTYLPISLLQYLLYYNISVICRIFSQIHMV